MLSMSSQLLSNVGVAAVVAVCAVTTAAFVAATISVAAYVAALKLPNQMHLSKLVMRHQFVNDACTNSSCILSQRSKLEALNQRAVVVVVNPIQSVKGKVVIDAFHFISPQTKASSNNIQSWPSQQTINSAINYRKNELEKMLLNLHKKKWIDGLTLRDLMLISKPTNRLSRFLLLIFIL